MDISRERKSNVLDRAEMQLNCDLAEVETITLHPETNTGSRLWAVFVYVMFSVRVHFAGTTAEFNTLQFQNDRLLRYKSNIELKEKFDFSLLDFYISYIYIEQNPVYPANARGLREVLVFN